MSGIPRSYADWRRCITVDCGLALTAKFIEARLSALREPSNEVTQQFVRRWGAEHHERVMAWFRQARTELEAGR